MDGLLGIGLIRIGAAGAGPFTSWTSYQAKSKGAQLTGYSKTLFEATPKGLKERSGSYPVGNNDEHRAKPPRQPTPKKHCHSESVQERSSIQGRNR